MLKCPLFLKIPITIITISGCMIFIWYFIFPQCCFIRTSKHTKNNNNNKKNPRTVKKKRLMEMTTELKLGKQKHYSSIYKCSILPLLQKEQNRNLIVEG